MNIIAEPERLSLGTSLPPGDPHGVSVQLPRWADTVGWATREPRVLEAMKTGYPRFFIPRVVHRLATRLLEILAVRAARGSTVGKTGSSTLGGRLALLLDTPRHAHMCRTSLLAWDVAGAGGANLFEVGVYVVSWDGRMTRADDDDSPICLGSAAPMGQEDIMLVSYPDELAAAAKSFWQHTGFGISSRRATYWLEHAPFLSPSTVLPPLPSADEISAKVDRAIAELKSRIAAGHSSPAHDIHVSPSDVFLFPTGMTAIAETAAAIQTLRAPTPDKPYCAAFLGFLYVDTFKLIPRVLGFTPGLFKPDDLASLASFVSAPADRIVDAVFTEFPGNPLLQSPSLSALSSLCGVHPIQDDDQPQGQEHQHPRGHSRPVLVVDDTVAGSYASVRLFPSGCDVLCTSLTKMFSGACNVMGGAVALNPRSPRREELRAVLSSFNNSAQPGVGAEDGTGALSRSGKSGGNSGTGGPAGSWFWQDVLTMELNSRDFAARVRRASTNAEAVVAMLRRSAAVREVYYPLGSPTQAEYDRYRADAGPEETGKAASAGQGGTEAEGEEEGEQQGKGKGVKEEGGAETGSYGYLLSIRFAAPAQAIAFYDALDVAKGPSLGTDFTLCCAYTLLAHYRELAWAAGYGVVEDLVRISVGLEERAWLATRVGLALRAAEECVGLANSRG